MRTLAPREANCLTQLTELMAELEVASNSDFSSSSSFLFNHNITVTILYLSLPCEVIFSNSLLICVDRTAGAVASKLSRVTSKHPGTGR